MQAITYSDLRQNLAKYADQVNEDYDELLVPRNNGNDIVIMSRSEYESLRETAYLNANPANAKALSDGIAAFDNPDRDKNYHEIIEVEDN